MFIGGAPVHIGPIVGTGQILNGGIILDGNYRYYSEMVVKITYFYIISVLRVSKTKERSRDDIGRSRR